MNFLRRAQGLRSVSPEIFGRDPLFKPIPGEPPLLREFRHDIRDFWGLFPKPRWALRLLAIYTLALAPAPSWLSGTLRVVRR